jgi:aerotaxis receptor
MREGQEIRQDSAPEGVDFGFHEIFFTRTDARSVIQSGNAVFQRVSEYSWAELLGAPHKVVRHPDMPKAVFRLFWDHLKRGEPVAAFVKNQTRSGGHYWVYAIVSPIHGGFISARIKPKGKIFDDVKDIYRKLIAFEAQNPGDTDASVARFLALLEGLGYAGYFDFMTRTLSAQMCQRNEQRRVATNPIHDKIARMLALTVTASTDMSRLERTMRNIQSEPTNMRIIAKHVPDGEPIGVIAGNYELMLHDALRRLRALATGQKNIFAEMYMKFLEGLLYLSIAELQSEVAHDFAAQADQAHPEELMDPGQEGRLLQQYSHDMAALAVAKLKDIRSHSARLPDFCRALKRQTTGMDIVRLLSKVEFSRIPTGAEGLGGIIERLGHFQAEVDARLVHIADMAKQIGSGSDAVQRAVLMPPPLIPAPPGSTTA